MHPFDADTAVEALENGNFSATITDRWNRLGGGPNGGYVLATCVRALSESMAFPDPLVVSAFFLRPALPGPAELEVEVVRAGRRVGTGQVTLSQKGKERVRAVATYGDLVSPAGRTSILREPPKLPPPDDCIDPLEGRSIEGVTISDRIEYRMADLPGWLEGKPSGRPEAELWTRFREERDPDMLALPLIVDAVAPIVLELGEIGSATVEMTVHLRNRPVPGWLACRVSTRYLINGIHEEDFEIWDSQGTLVAQSRQLAVLPATR